MGLEVLRLAADNLDKALELRLDLDDCLVEVDEVDTLPCTQRGIPDCS